ncbi:MAG: aminotransferase class V-fold PLP-dependent enzyme, partial [Planctomycetes bacterium]|nr:aminotransferase class V-fold PLP-dependent enzyme [Planctomycetota bacterium]
YTACLHKWLMGPVGTGVFTVQAPWIARLWPLHPADALHTNTIAKFEQWGTHAVAPFLALDEALDLHEQLGATRIAARLDHLRTLLAGQLRERRGVTLWTDPTPGRSAALLAVEAARVPAAELAAWLWREHRIHVTTAPLGERHVLRLSPHLFTTPDEISRVVAAVGAAAELGI